MKNAFFYCAICIFNLSLSKFAFANSNGFSEWWFADEKIDYQQKTELDALEGDDELWCALAELFTGSDEVLEAGCVFTEEKESGKKGGEKKQKKNWKADFKSGANVDSSGNLSRKFVAMNANAKAGKIGNFSGTVQKREGNDLRWNATYRKSFLYTKMGTLHGDNLGVLAEFEIGDLHLGGEYVFREMGNEAQKDTNWIFGKYNRNFFDRKFFITGNFSVSLNNLFGLSNAAGNDESKTMFSRTSQGLRLNDWVLKVTEIASARQNKDAISFSAQAARRRRGAGLVFDWNEKRSGVSAGIKPAKEGTDSVWAKAEYPLRLRIGLDKKMQNVRISNSFFVRENWTASDPLQFRSESKIMLPILFSPFLTMRLTVNFYTNSQIILKQFYAECGARF